jgi:ABC-type Mn2+/Zn2+ transport system permease subunit
MNEIIINTSIAGFFLSIIFGILSVFVILRKLSFLGVGISHSAFAGISLSFLLGTEPFITTLIFCLIIAFLIGKTTKMGKMDYDNSIGLFFSFTMALGAIFLYLNKNYNFDIMGYLFGSILGVSNGDIVLIIVISFLSTAVSFLFLKEFIFIAFDEDVAKVSGLNVELFDNILLIILSGVIVISIKLIGIILVSALLIIPGTLSLLICKNYKKAFLVSIIFNMVIFFLGGVISWELDLPIGATIVTIGTFIYFAVLLFKK